MLFVSVCDYVVQCFYVASIGGSRLENAVVYEKNCLVSTSINFSKSDNVKLKNIKKQFFIVLKKSYFF